MGKGARLSSRGSDGEFGGGSVCIIAANEFVNEGVIDCGSDGRIEIRCAKFVNEGRIEPEPKVVISNSEEKERTECEVEIFRPWTLRRDGMQKIGLTVEAFRGCLWDKEYYHPRNLLDGKGTETHYWSRGGLPDGGAGDWIIFRMDSETARVPSKVRIRNSDNQHGNGLRRIKLSIGSDAETFTHSIIIDDIHRGNMEEQEFDVAYSFWKLGIRREQCKFIKLTV